MSVVYDYVEVVQDETNLQQYQMSAFQFSFCHQVVNVDHRKCFVASLHRKDKKIARAGYGGSLGAFAKRYTESMAEPA